MNTVPENERRGIAGSESRTRVGDVREAEGARVAHYIVHETKQVEELHARNTTDSLQLRSIHRGRNQRRQAGCEGPGALHRWDEADVRDIPHHEIRSPGELELADDRGDVRGVGHG